MAPTLVSFAAIVSLAVISAARTRVSLNRDEKKACKEISWLFGDVSCGSFIARHWEKQPLLSRGTARSRSLFATRDMPTLFSLWEMRVNRDHGQVLFVRPGTFSHDEGLGLEGDRVAYDAAVRAHDNGRTVVVHNMEIYWGPVNVLSRALSRLFSLYCQVNMYWSPGGLETSISPHQDAQSVFIVQLEGTKRWRLFNPPDRVNGVPNGPLALKKTQRGKGGDRVDVDDLGADIMDVTLAPGDVLYVPRGVFHVTSTAGSPRASLHLTVGVETETDDNYWGSVISDAISAVAKDMPVHDGAFRRPLPHGALRDRPQGKPSGAARGPGLRGLKRMIGTLSKVADSTWEQALGDVLMKRRAYLQTKWDQQQRFLDNFNKRTMQKPSDVQERAQRDGL